MRLRDSFANLNLLPWPTLATAVPGLESLEPAQVSAENVTGDQRSDEFYAGTVEDTKTKMLEPTELNVTDNIRDDL